MSLRQAMLLACCLGFWGGCATSPKNLARFEFETPQMGVPFQIILYAPNTNTARAAAEAAFARVSELNALLSDYEYESELNRLSRTSGSAEKVAVSAELWTVLAAAEKISHASAGALDVTIGPLVQLWRKARREQKLPPTELLQRARSRVGYTNILLTNRTAELKIADMRLDLGAIAKGYAADEALRILRKHGVKSALCAASGDMALGDPPPGEPGWKVQLPNAADQRGKGFLILSNCGAATSGDLFQFVDIEGKRYSHIVDPHTGLGLTDRSMVTVFAKDGITADGLSTAISVLPPRQGLALARAFDAEAHEKRVLANGTRVDSATPQFWTRVRWLK